jgi:hypothetical protein
MKKRPSMRKDKIYPASDALIDLGSIGKFPYAPPYSNLLIMGCS